MKLVCSDWQTMESDGKTVSPFSEFGTVQNYDVTAPEQLAQRLAGAQVLLCNKTLVTAETLEHCPDLQYIGVLPPVITILIWRQQPGMALLSAMPVYTQPMRLHSTCLLLF